MLGEALRPLALTPNEATEVIAVSVLGEGVRVMHSLSQVTHRPWLTSVDVFPTSGCYERTLTVLPLPIPTPAWVSPHRVSPWSQVRVSGCDFDVGVRIDGRLVVVVLKSDHSFGGYLHERIFAPTAIDNSSVRVHGFRILLDIVILSNVLVCGKSYGARVANKRHVTNADRECVNSILRHVVLSSIIGRGIRVAVAFDSL